MFITALFVKPLSMKIEQKMVSVLKENKEIVNSKSDISDAGPGAQIHITLNEWSKEEEM